MSKTLIDQMFEAGVHYGYSKSRRHPSVRSYIYTTKNKIDYIDLEKTAAQVENASQFIKTLSQTGRTVLFVGVKPEARDAAINAGNVLSLPYAKDRWIGGTITNFPEIKKRIARLDDLKIKKEKGELEMYTKKERLMLDREVDRLERYFGGMLTLKKTPDALIVVDPKKEHIAVVEAKRMNIPVIAIASTDCNIKEVDYPIVANDGSRGSIAFILDTLVQAYKDGQMMK
jgi:small subunit ribosomal protein S2